MFVGIGKGVKMGEYFEFKIGKISVSEFKDLIDSCIPNAFEGWEFIKLQVVPCDIKDDRLIKIAILDIRYPNADAIFSVSLLKNGNLESKLTPWGGNYFGDGKQEKLLTIIKNKVKDGSFKLVKI